MADNEELGIRATATEAAQGPNVIPGAGLRSDDPEAQARMQEALKMRGLDYARAGIMGAAAGGQAGAQTMNPMAAFVQGMAAGLQAPAQIYAQKREQAQSVYDATPFGVTHSEVVKDERYRVLAGLPTGIALKVIGAIAQDSAKIAAEGIEARKSESEKGRVTAQSAPGYAKLIKDATGRDYDPEMLIGLDENELKEYAKMGGVDMSKVYDDESKLRNEFIGQIKAESFNTIRDQYFNLSDASKAGTAPGDMKMIFSYMKMLDPGSIVRESEYATAQNAAGIPQRIIGAYNKALDGQSLSPQQRQEFMAEARDIWKRKTKTFKATVDTYRQLAKNSGFNPNKVVTNVGNVLAYTDPNDARYVPMETAPEIPAQRKEGDIFTEIENGWISTFKVINKNGNLVKVRVSSVEDK